MKGDVQVKNLMHGHIVTNYFQRIVVRRFMKGLTQVKNLIDVLFATDHLHKIKI